MLPSETLTDYRRRLRVLVEDLALAGTPKTLNQILGKWRAGLNPLFKEWLFLMERAHPEPGSAASLIYRFERFIGRNGGAVEIDNIAFVVSIKSRRPTPPDFRIWEYIGRGWVYAHDFRRDHEGVRPTDTCSDEMIMYHISKCNFPKEVLLNRPTIIPMVESNLEEGSSSYSTPQHQSTQEADIPPSDQARGVRMRTAMEAGLEQMVERCKKMRGEPSRPASRRIQPVDFTHSTFSKFGEWKGSPKGGWISGEDAVFMKEEKPFSVPKLKLDLCLAPPRQNVEIYDISSSSDEEEYPPLDARDKGKRPLHPQSPKK